MHFSPHFVRTDVYSTPLTPFAHRYQTFSHEPVEPVATAKPSVSFCIHCQDARQEQYPSCVLNYRPTFSERIAKLKSQAVNMRRELLLKDRVDSLQQDAQRVKRVTADYHVKSNEGWRRTREHITSDMQEHLQRRERRQIERVEALRLHNELVKSRCELLRYGNYLRRIARQHEVRRKRRSIF